MTPIVQFFFDLHVATVKPNYDNGYYAYPLLQALPIDFDARRDIVQRFIKQFPAIVAEHVGDDAERITGLFAVNEDDAIQLQHEIYVWAAHFVEDYMVSNIDEVHYQLGEYLDQIEREKQAGDYA